jgi:hypothetical protein
MSEKNENWVINALVSTATLAVGSLLFIVIVWLAASLGLPRSLSWTVLVMGPLVIGGVYVLVGFTSLGKYLWSLPPGSLG